jgi:hypothetical protein
MEWGGGITNTPPLPTKHFNEQKKDYPTRVVKNPFPTSLHTNDKERIEAGTISKVMRETWPVPWELDNNGNNESD